MEEVEEEVDMEEVEGLGALARLARGLRRRRSLTLQPHHTSLSAQG